jgi:hypothetical protein
MVRHRMGFERRDTEPSTMVVVSMRCGADPHGTAFTLTRLLLIIILALHLEWEWGKKP